MIYTANVYSYNEMKLDLDPVESIVLKEQDLMALNEVNIGQIFKSIWEWLVKMAKKFLEWIKGLLKKIKIGKMKSKAMAKKADEFPAGDSTGSDNADEELEDYEEVPEEEPSNTSTEEVPEENTAKEEDNQNNKSAPEKFKFSKKSALQHGYDLYKAKLGNIVMDMVTKSSSLFSDEWTESIERDIEIVFRIILESNNYDDVYFLKPEDELTNDDISRLLHTTAFYIHSNQIMERYYAEYFNGIRIKNAKELLKALNSRTQYSNKIFYPGIQDAPTPDELKNGTFYESDIKRVEACANDMVKAYKDLAEKLPKIQRKYIQDENKLTKEQSTAFYRAVSRINILLQDSVQFSVAMSSVIDEYVNNIYNKLCPEMIRAYVKFGRQNNVDVEERMRFNLAPEGFISGTYRESAMTKSLFESVCLL